jgi:hypothetical protein
LRNGIAGWGREARKKEEGRRKKEEGRRKKEEGKHVV